VEQAEFVDVESASWWLLEEVVPEQVETRRTRPGAILNWSDPAWFEQREHLQELHSLLQGSSPNLLTELDDATTVDQQIAWLDELLAVVGPTDGPDRAGSAEESADDAVGRPAPAPPPAEAAATTAKKPSIFAKKKAVAETHESEAEGVDEQPASAPDGRPAADEADPAAPDEPAKKSIFAKKAAAEQPPEESESIPHLSEEELKEAASSAVSSVMEDLGSLAGDLGMKEDELQKLIEGVDLEALVAEELAALTDEATTAE
jgi:cell pole-organizing protein PopZ